MKNLKIKQKILLLTVLPLLVTVLALLAVSIYELRSMGAQEIEKLRATMMTNKQETLKNYINIAATSVQPLLKEAATNPAVLDQLKKQLSTIRYDKGNGYIFAFTYDGVAQVQDAKPELIGRNLMDLKDVNGKLFMQELFSRAKEGGGFVDYIWHKPSVDDTAPKLSYAANLPEVNWMIGTGFYIDDIDTAIAAAKAEMDERLMTLILFFVGVGVAILLILLFISIRFANRALVEPIQQLSESASQMSLGKMDTEITIDSKDEIGDLADATKRMQKSLKVIFKKLKQGGD